MTSPEEYFRLLHEEYRECAFATIGDDGRPAIRIIDLMLHDADGVYFLTARGKDFYRQLVDQEFVALTAHKDYRMISLRGKVRQLDHAVIDDMFAANPGMAELYPGDTRAVLEPFHLYEGQGEYLDINTVPVQHESFSFGGAELLDRGYRVTDDCTGCGSCVPACPQACIQLDGPDGRARIVQEHCLRCGACAEACPFDAIERA